MPGGVWQLSCTNLGPTGSSERQAQREAPGVNRALGRAAG